MTRIQYRRARRADVPYLWRAQRDREGFSIEKLLETQEASVALVATLTLLAFALRFYKINHPDQVV